MSQHEQDKKKQRIKIVDYEIFEQRVQDILEKLRNIDERSLEQESLYLLLHNELVKVQHNYTLVTTVNDCLHLIEENSKSIAQISEQSRQFNKNIQNLYEWKQNKDNVDSNKHKKVDEIQESVNNLKNRNVWTWDRFVRVGGFAVLLISAIVSTNVYYLKDIFLTKNSFSQYIEQNEAKLKTAADNNKNQRQLLIELKSELKLLNYRLSKQENKKD